jgi:hypothetical protein
VVRVHPAVPNKLLQINVYLRKKLGAFIISTIKEPPRNHGNIFRGSLGFYPSRIAIFCRRCAIGCRAWVPRRY